MIAFLPDGDELTDEECFDDHEMSTLLVKDLSVNVKNLFIHRTNIYKRTISFKKLKLFYPLYYGAASI